MRHKATKLEAWVEVSADEGQNWEVLDEYRAEYTKDTAKCYVEAKAGQQFRMLWRDTDYMHKRGTYLLEGFYDGYAAGALAVTRPLTNIPACFEGVQNSDTTILPFMFEKVRVYPCALRFGHFTYFRCVASIELIPPYPSDTNNRRRFGSL
jgi:hypothetical protein